VPSDRQRSALPHRQRRGVHVFSRGQSPCSRSFKGSESLLALCAVLALHCVQGVRVLARPLCAVLALHGTVLPRVLGVLRAQALGAALRKQAASAAFTCATGRSPNPSVLSTFVNVSVSAPFSTMPSASDVEIGDRARLLSRAVRALTARKSDSPKSVVAVAAICSLPLSARGSAVMIGCADCDASVGPTQAPNRLRPRAPHKESDV
jgi:hypothetical protein